MARKWMFAAGGIVLALLLGSGWAVKNLLETNADLRGQVSQFEEVNDRLNNTIKEQEEEMIRRENILRDRESRIRAIQRERDEIRESWEDALRESGDECAATPIPDDLRDRLL